MTAEIGVLNGLGVALAADSAVTVGSSKVFNTADKLFSLSKHHPVGIMIYGNAGFMGVPWETIIKVYRKKLGDITYRNLKDYSDDFFHFLISDDRFYDKEYEKKLIGRKFYKFLDKILDEINLMIPEIWKVEPSEEQVAQMIYGMVDFYATEYVGTDYITSLNDDYFDVFDKQFKEYIIQIIESRINFEIDFETKTLFVLIAACLVVKDHFHEETGVVIAGFGDDEIFPVLISYEVEGIFNGVLKYKEEHNVEISATNPATIVPFAQQEMVHSFLTGIDPELKKQVVGLIDSITSLYPAIIDEHIIQLDDDQKERTLGFGKDLLRQFQEQIEQMINVKFSGPVMNTVSSFPKEELAAMAEALVNLTSIKRKMSFQTETVGGPIDVAVISKGDGFIWIKRKHYFKPELNHTYFTNYMER
ncbi:hypothetical protein [Paenibacillus odorifer]|uniref:hypothetical protein n=1 Tax=Paenibacillus odorifer TaxID=189426 RepID=UPI00096FE5B5|nr:hypothetical protein [Paenibacillus odorifer]OME55106.1 hypothetical protein BSK61_13640 [Paenibacillus odorifer]